MLRPINNLAADLDAAYTEHLLESGNLKRKTEWSDDSRWTSLGYTANLHECTCPSCSAKTLRFIGFSHKEKTPSGAIREQYLTAKAQLPLSTPLTVFVSPVAEICPDCALSAFPNQTWITP
jgi:hypothetical protein